ncbi:tyrosine-protein phosphatase [Marinicrinis lubricantis]|uniref:Tyrosine-protein phosphatase n=1 Tax=Marinicrinis lubricantis TaxID=2086470 RepID=A0ABW1IPJ0_9BACL
MKKNAKLHWVRLPLEGIENCRELGGYSTSRGQQTEWHRFLRSSDMSRMTQEDKQFLKEYGVTTVIDLRGEDEMQTHPNPLAGESFCTYHNIPLITRQVSEMERPAEDAFIGDFYIELLDHHAAVKRIFDTIADAPEGCVLFHCQAGKDRTGVLAMLLLGLAGVAQKDIVSNYEVTYSCLESVQKQEIVFDHIPTSFLYSHRDYIVKAYEHLVAHHQSVEQYLLAKGVEPSVLDRVKPRLVKMEDAVVS